MSNAQFRRDFARIIQKAKELPEVVVKRVALDLQTAMIERSPVDTGRFRGNWQVGINSINLTTKSEADKSGAASASRSQRAIASYKLGNTIYLTNSLPYAQRLEYGSWSKQAPNGMVRITVVEYEQFIRKAAAQL